MKLRDKEFIASGLLLALFLVLTSISAVRNNLFIFVPIVVIFVVLLVGFFDYFILKPILELNKIITHQSIDHSKLNATQGADDDEAFLIASKIHSIVKTNQLLQEQIDEKERAGHFEAPPLTLIETKIENNVIKQLEQADSSMTFPGQILFNEILNKTLSQAKRHHHVVAILIVDFDFLDKEKHHDPDVVDYAIKDIGKRFIKVLRTEDVISKLEGNEFIILLSDIHKPKFAGAVADKILHVCSDAIKIDYQDLFSKASVGISIYPDDGDSLEDMIENAYSALSKASLNADKDYQFYSEKLDSESREYIELNTELRKAIDEKRLTLYYQPKLHIKTGNIVGVEALLRWIHPTLGVINPQKFIPIAEDAGLINKIGEWALMEACKTNKYWQNEGYEHISVSINLSPKQFVNPEIAKIISIVLKETDLSPNYLEIEITESTVMNDLELASQILESIKETGVQITMDHFGAGSTSISHLKKLPFSTVKIDANFIKGIPNSQIDSVITTAIIALAHNLGLKTVAQGVETASQVQFLAQHDCDMVQGYFLSYPIPAENVVQQFKKLTDRVIM